MFKKNGKSSEVHCSNQHEAFSDEQHQQHWAPHCFQLLKSFDILVAIITHHPKRHFL